MTDNVVDFNGYTTLDLNPDDILENNKGKFEKVVIIGINEDGVITGHSSVADKPTIIYLLESLKFDMLNT